MASQIVVVTDAARGFARLSANAVAHGGHTVYAAMRETAGCNASQARDVADYAREEGVDLRTIDLDVGSQASVDQAIAAIIIEHGRIDVLVHNADRTAFGPAEAFTPEQFAELYDAVVLSAQRLNRAVLPHMRRRVGGGEVEGAGHHDRCLDAPARQLARILRGKRIQRSLGGETG